MSLRKAHSAARGGLLVRPDELAHLRVGLVEEAHQLALDYVAPAQQVVEVEVHALKTRRRYHCKSLFYAMYVQYAASLHRFYHIAFPPYKHRPHYIRSAPLFQSQS